MKYDYHDATLKILRIDWTTHIVEIEFILCSEESLPVCMTVTKVRKLCCPYEAPWGDSSSVNTIKVIKLTECGVRLEIEMQSGDTISLEGKEMIEREHE